MKAQIEFHPLFWEDVQGHAVYLETQAQLGGEFLDAVELAIETVRTGPLMWSCLFGNIRHYLLSKFRNHVIHYEFFEDENMVRFYGLYHGAQDPAKWSDRL